jgi:hypothetical protein
MQEWMEEKFKERGNVPVATVEKAGRGRIRHARPDVDTMKITTSPVDGSATITLSDGMKIGMPSLKDPPGATASATRIR